MGSTPIRTVRGLTVEILNSIGVDNIESGVSGNAAEGGLISAMVPADITARRASRRVKWSVIYERLVSGSCRPIIRSRLSGGDVPQIHRVAFIHDLVKRRKGVIPAAALGTELHRVLRTGLDLLSASL